MNYIVEKTTSQLEAMKPAEVDTYLIKYTKVAKEVDGTEVTVIDEERTEQVTVEQLESQKVSHQEAIKQIEEKLSIIKAL